MSIPKPFEVTDPTKLAEVIRHYSFATVVTQQDGIPLASHLPILFEPEHGQHGRLIGHMAKDNPQWKQFENESSVLTIFHGPHAYISPSLYESRLSVPTWNYVAIHVYGRPQLIQSADQLIQILERMIETYDPQPATNSYARLPVEFREKLLRMIVGFEIQIERMEGKFKLGQNRSQADLRKIHLSLSSSTDTNDLSLAEFVKPYLS